MPRVFGGASRSPSRADGEWNCMTSSVPWPPDVRRIAMSTPTPSSPTTRSTHSPSTGSLAPQPGSELDEELRRGREVLDDDAHVLQALDRHAGPPSGGGGSFLAAARARAAWRTRW